MAVVLIQNPAALAQLCARLTNSAWLALDTEFMRESTYYARLCLLQLGTEELLACVDPLTVDLAPLLDILYNPSTLKILHAGRQDLEVLNDVRRLQTKNDDEAQVPCPLFDTQIAAALLGYPDQVGYAALVESIVGVKLPKLHTRTDWSVRPLSEEQLHYAEDDVRYLRDVYHKLDEELLRRGRREWLTEECVALADPALYRNDPATAYLRLKAAGTLDAAAQSRLKALAAWRERTAQTRDRPRGWILPDPALIEIARTSPKDIAALGSLSLTPKQIETHGEAILATLEQPGVLEKICDESVPPTTAEQNLARAMTAHVQAVATAEAISPTLIATKRAIFALIREGSGPLTRGWRWELIGQTLAGMAQGKTNAQAGR